jgi:hypothetical protein
MAKKSWRDVLPIHPAAELFPLMSPDALRVLGADIRKNGLMSSVAVWSDGKSPLQLLDGRSRLDAIESEIGPAMVGAPSITAGEDFLACNNVIVLDRSVDPYAYVISANIHRRHLTAEQKREIVAALLKANPERSNNATAKIAKVDDKTVGAVRAELERRSEIPNVSTRTDSKGRQQPARKTTAKCGTVKFTPERMQQIINLVEQGMRREEIAELIGVTVGSLQVTCSRLGISLRKPLPTVESVPSQDAASRGDISPTSNDEGEETKATRKPEGEGDDSELGNLLRAWDRASQGTREKFKTRVGLVAVEPPAKVMDDGLDIPEWLRRVAP